MQIEIKGGRGVATASLSGELDHHGCEEIRQELDGLLLMPTTKVLILDMSGVSFMDSSGMGLLLARNKLAVDRQVQLIICGPSPEITKLLQMVALDKQIPLFGTHQEAVEYLDKRG